MVLGIEYICTANGGRSPQFQTIGRDHVAQKGLEGKIKIYSSGSAANELMNFPMLEIIGYIEIGLRRGAYKGKALGMAQEVVKNKEQIAQAAESGDQTARGMIGYCNNFLMVDEEAKRNLVLLELGLVPEGPFHKQTVVRDNVDLILTMKQSNADKVKGIYQGSGRNPVIIPVCKYAGIEGEISDPFGGTLEDFRRTRDFIAIVAKKSIDRAIEEYDVK